jgi:MFS family permease
MVTDPLHSRRGGSPAAGELSTLAVVSSAHLVSHLHIMTLPVLLHLLTDRMHVGYFELGLAMTIFNVVSGLAQAPMGFVVDRIGARSVLLAGLLLGGAAFASLALLDSYAWLLVASLLAGLANCVYHPADYALLSDHIADQRIGRGFSVHTFAGFFGGAIAPPFLLAVADAAGVGPSLLAAGAFAWVVAAVIVMLPAAPGARHARAARAAEVPLREILNPTVLGLALFFTLLALSGSAMYSFAIPALIGAHGISSGSATAALTAYLTASAAGVLAGGPVADRTVRHGDVTAAGFALSAAIALAVATLTLSGPVLVVAMAATGFLFGVIQPSRDMLVRKAAPPGAAGRVFGIVSTGFNVGGVVGPLLFGWLMDRGAPRWVFGVAVLFMAATALLGVLEERYASLWRRMSSWELPARVSSWARTAGVWVGAARVWVGRIAACGGSLLVSLGTGLGAARLTPVMSCLEDCPRDARRRDGGDASCGG